MDWEPRARALARAVTDPHSRWHLPLAATPRHVFVPRWWEDRHLADGPADEDRWAEAAYSDQTLVISIGGLHADHAGPGDCPRGLPTSSSTLPSLVVRMYRHARLYDGADVLDAGTGSGYGCALLAARFGDAAVTSMDVDPYLSKAAGERLSAVGLGPRLVTGDATGPLPGQFDRIISMISAPVVPGSWLEALRPGGRLVTVLAGTMIIITATKNDDGWATGRVEWDRAGFMAARSGPDYPPATMTCSRRSSMLTATTSGRAVTPSFRSASPGSCGPCWRSPRPGSATTTTRTVTAPAPPGWFIPTGPGLGPPPPERSRPWSTRAGRAACGTSSMTCARTG